MIKFFHNKEKKCLGILKLKIASRNQEDSSSFLKFNLDICGTFSVEKFEEEEKKQIESQTFQRLYPYLQTYTTAITAIAGIPPIIIPEPLAF